MLNRVVPQLLPHRHTSGNVSGVVPQPLLPWQTNSNVSSVVPQPLLPWQMNCNSPSVVPQLRGTEALLLTRCVACRLRGSVMSRIVLRWVVAIGILTCARVVLLGSSMDQMREGSVCFRIRLVPWTPFEMYDGVGVLFES